MHTRSSVLIGVVLVSAIAGCKSAGNDRLTIGPERDGAIVIESVTRGRLMEPAQDRSLHDISRSDWRVLEYVVPVDQINHGPILTGLVPQYSGSDRGEGRFPKAETALRVDENRYASAETVSGIAHAGLDVVLMVPRLFAPGLLLQTVHHDRYQQHVEASLSPEPTPVPGTTVTR